MSRLDRLRKAQEESNKKTFHCSDLNEGNVQTIFNSCLANANTKEMVTSYLFPIVLGYKQGSEKPIHFDKDSLLKYKKNIEYLFGQLHRVHDPNGTYKMSIDDFNKTYQNKHWATNKAILLKLLYLGVVPETLVIAPFKADTSLSMIAPAIKPTLSPKDPNFTAWWEAHKSEWE